MKHTYLFLFMVFTLSLSAQERVDSLPSQTEQTTDFKLYPNPAFDGVVYITTKQNGSKDIVVYDVFGKVVLRDRISTSTLNIARLVPGVYVLQVRENNTTMRRKLVVK